MVHFNKDPLKVEPPLDSVKNEPCQHAFVLVGEQTLFAVHMTQFHDELHKYQIIFELELDQTSHAQLKKLRKRYPTETLFFCNGDPHEDHFPVPGLAAGNVTQINGNIFVGLRLPPAPEKLYPHWFPWNLRRVHPAIPNVQVTVKRIVLYRLFAHHEILPPYATFFIWGKGDEAHMTNKQIGTLASDKFDKRLFGPDTDMVMSLDARPDWLPDDNLLEAGIVVSAAGAPNYDAQTGAPSIPCKLRWQPGDSFQVLYRGVSPARPVTAGQTYMQCSAVVNSEELVPCGGDDMWGMTVMPFNFWNTEEE